METKAAKTTDIAAAVEPQADAPAPAHVLATGTKKERRELIDEVFATWVDDFIRHSPISQHTPSWNYLQEQLPALAARILKET